MVETKEDAGQTPAQEVHVYVSIFCVIATLYQETYIAYVETQMKSLIQFPCPSFRT